MHSGHDAPTHVDWREWGPEAFAEAAATDRPVLLSLVATWCGDCHRMDAETYAEPRIAAAIDDGFVPVRVDVDRRPRVRDRYNVGGFPSTVFCTPAGEVLTGATYLGPDGFRGILERVRETYAADGESAGRVPRGLDDGPTPAGDVAGVEGALVARLDETFDDRYGGWGDGAKFPLPRTVGFALKRRRDQAIRTLDAVRENLFDPVDGGFFRFAGRPDWSDVRHEKLLADNAGVVRAFADAYLYTGADRFRRPAAETVAFLTDDLWTGTAMGGSVGPAAGRDYYALDAAGRAEASPPRTDLVAYAGANALAADALYAFAAYTDDERARTYADRTVDALRGLVDDDGRVTHYRAASGTGGSPAPTGLLADQARVTAAFARAAQVTGEGVDVARSTAAFALDALRDVARETDEAVGPDVDPAPFRDGPMAGAEGGEDDADAVGLLDRPLRPLDATVEMADALVDLAALTGEDGYARAARRAVAAFAGAADRMGPQVAGFGAVAARCTRDPLVVRVGTPVGSDLHRAALRVADHEKVVVPDAPGVDDGAVVGREGAGDADPARTPDELVARVAAWSEGA